jgi:hypothetical protein
MSEHNHPAADRLEAFVEGTLREADRAVLESHLLTCPPCQTQVEEWRGLFAALSSLPQFEPTVGFATRVMTHVRVAPRAAWQEWADRAGALAARVAPRTNYGWSLAVALFALPILLGGGAIAWLVSKSYITSDALLGYTRESIVDGLQGMGTTVITFVMQTEIAAWVVANVGAVISTAGVTGLGAILAGAGSLTVLSTWVLYRNLFRSPSRESDYALYSL